jgi:hypothetical protein
VIRALVEAAAGSDSPVIVPRYADGGGANPILLRREAFDLARQATGDRGLGPILAADPGRVTFVPVEGSNPDVDTPADLAEIGWADRVRANRRQVDRLREVPDGADFYRHSTSLFVADPRRTGDAVLEALLALARPDDAWLDVGAGAGRYALPLALAVREVIAIDPSAAMRTDLAGQAAAAGIANIRILDGRWPPEPGGPLAAALGPLPAAEVALIAHVGYDIESIGPFVDGLEAASRRRCVAVLMDRTPASAAAPFWPRVHGEDRIPLPALDDFVELLRVRGRDPDVALVERGGRAFASREDLERLLRRQLWIGEGTPKEQRFLALLDELAVEGPDGWSVRDQPELQVGVVSWVPR